MHSCHSKDKYVSWQYVLFVRKLCGFEAARLYCEPVNQVSSISLHYFQFQYILPRQLCLTKA